VLENFRPRELWLSADAVNPELEEITRTARKLEVKIVRFGVGETQEFGGAQIRILAPPSHPTVTRRNDESLVIKVTFKNTAALQEADAEKQSEQRIALEQPAADLLKIAHHGSALPHSRNYSTVCTDFCRCTEQLWPPASGGPGEIGTSPRGHLSDGFERSRELLLRRQQSHCSSVGSSLISISAVSSLGARRYS
jgi:hypothetical protein